MGCFEGIIFSKDIRQQQIVFTIICKLLNACRQRPLSILHMDNKGISIYRKQHVLPINNLWIQTFEV